MPTAGDCERRQHQGGLRDAVPVGGGEARASTRAPSPARLEAAAGPAGPGRASNRRAEPPINDPAPLVWRAPEGPEGTGGLRGAAPNEVRPPSLAGGRALRRPEHQRGHKQRKRAAAREGRRAFTQLVHTLDTVES